MQERKGFNHKKPKLETYTSQQQLKKFDPPPLRVEGMHSRKQGAKSTSYEEHAALLLMYHIKVDQ